MNLTTLRKIWGDIITRKVRTLLVAMSIFIGVLGVVTLVSASDILVEQLNADIQEDELAMGTLLVTTQGEGTIDNAGTLALLSTVAGITDVEGQAADPIYWRQDAGDHLQESMVWAFSEAYGSIDIMPPTLLEGDYPVEGQHEIAVEVRTAENHDLSVGDSIDIRMLGMGDEMQTWTISGLVFHPYNSDYFRQSFYATYPESQAITGARGYRFINARFEDFATAEAQFPTLQSVLQQNTPYTIMMTTLDDPAESRYITDLADLVGVLSALGIVAMLVSGFLVINVINNLVVEQKRQIGVLKSLGATRRETFTVYSGIVLVYGLLGMIPAVLLGIPLGFELAQLIGDFAGTYITDFRVSTLGVGLGIFLGIATPVIAAALPVYNGTRVSILEAMTDLGISGGYQAGFLSRLVNRLPIPAMVKQSFNNILHKKGRLALTVFTLMLAVAAFIGVSAVFVNLDNTIDDVTQTVTHEVEITPNSGQSLDTMRSVLSGIDSIDEVYPGTMVAASIEGFLSPFTNDSQVFLFGTDPQSPTFTPTYLEGSGWQDDPDREGIVITSGLADQMNVGVGDTLEFMVAGTIHEQEIIGVANFLLDMIFTDWRYASTISGLSNGEPHPNVFFVDFKAAKPSVAEVDEQIDLINEKLLANGITGVIGNQTEQVEQLSQGIRSIGILMNLASLIMAAVGAIGLLTTLLLAVFERQKEIGVMRTVGARSPMIIMQFLIEGLLVGVLAWLIAVPIGIALAYGISSLLPFGDLVAFEFPVVLIPVGLVGILVIATLSSIGPSLMAARKTVSEILRYQ